MKKVALFLQGFAEGFVNGWNGTTTKPAKQQPQAVKHKAVDAKPDVREHLTQEELKDVLRLLAEAPTESTTSPPEVGAQQEIPPIPDFYFPETVEGRIEEIDPAYGTWVEMAQQGYLC